MKLNDLGLKCAPERTRINGAIEYEPPVNLTLESEWNGECKVGAFSYVNPFSVFSHVTVGRYCSLAQWLILGPGQHITSGFSTHPFVGDPDDSVAQLSEYPSYSNILVRKAPRTLGTQRSLQNERITIGHDVWIGTRAIIMQGVTIGHGAIVAAGAIVTKDVPPYAIVAGVPAKIIRYRFEKALIDRFLESNWWDYDMTPVSKSVDYSNPETVLRYIENLKTRKTLQKFSPPRIRVERNGNEFKVTQVS